MNVYKSSVELEGSCNYCNKSKLNSSGTNLIYSYKDVIIIKGRNIATVMCKECFEELTAMKFDDIK